MIRMILLWDGKELSQLDEAELDFCEEVTRRFARTSSNYDFVREHLRYIFAVDLERALRRRGVSRL